MFFSFDEEDYVLHEKYGIGKFVGLERIKFNHTSFDFFKIAYRNNDFLFIPSYNVGVLKFHSTKVAPTVIDSLNKPQSLRKYNKAKEEIQKTAIELIEFAAKRGKSRAFSLKNTSFFDDFCSEFEHELTKSQAKSIKEIIDDLQKTVPMDRLLCGDVGFGKTEVAARAIAYTVFNEKKALFLVPTTVLALQHYKTLNDRFEKMGKKCALLSKLSENSELIKKAWQKGEIDFLIATVHHKGVENLLIPDLCLIVLDEEHHFGVKFKEKIREYTHLLQLSATPIPRTLHLALSSVKSISMLEEAPYNKKKINVFIENLSNINLKKLIQKEIEYGGKIFLVVPRIQYIEEIENLVKELSLSYVVLHGQMNKNDMNSALDDFLYNDVSIMIATNIIESGVNVTSVNLMIVFHSHMFGIAQLHQLKGRIGRNESIANVYFIVPKSLKDISIDRLNMIKENSEFGDGFNLSRQDMETRGSGTVAGYKQSGKDYGFGLETYYDLLTEELGKKVCSKKYNNIAWINFGDAYLSSDYISDSKLRLAFYKKLSFVESDEDLNLIIEDLKEFGDYPVEVENFLKVIKINILNKYGEIVKVVNNDDSFCITFKEMNDDIIKKFSSKFKILGNEILDFI